MSLRWVEQFESNLKTRERVSNDLAIVRSRAGGDGIIRLPETSDAALQVLVLVVDLHIKPSPKPLSGSMIGETKLIVPLTGSLSGPALNEMVSPRLEFLNVLASR